jgi:hypothetical protein
MLRDLRSVNRDIHPFPSWKRRRPILAANRPDGGAGGNRYRSLTISG